MKCFNFSNLPTPVEGAAPGGWQGTRRHVRAGLLVFALAWLVGAVAQAQVPYAADPAFANGQYILDDFWSNPTADNNYFEGKKVARLSNGDIVVAALVKNPNANQTNGYWNIGLVRYNAAGTERVLWPNGGSYSHVDGNYIVYPKSNTATFTRIRGLEVSGDNILVATNLVVGSDEDSYVLVFGTDGSFKSSTPVFNTTANEYIGGMAVSSIYAPSLTTSVVLVGHRFSAGVGFRPLFRRFTLGSNGSLTAATDIVNLNTHWCADTTRDCAPIDIALGDRILTPPAIYVVSRGVNTSFTPAQVCMTVTRVSSNGTADASWPSNYCDTFDDGTGTTIKANTPVAIAVSTTGQGTVASPYRDSVFVAAEIERQCRNGVLVQRFNHDYLTAGSTVFGGTPGICGAVKTTDYPTDMVLSGGKLAVVGFNRSQLLNFDPNYTGWVAFLDASGSSNVPLLDHTDYPMPGGANYRDTALQGIVPTGNDKFIVTGDGRYPNDSSVPESLRGKNAVATLGIAPAGGGGPAIFSDGFESGGGNNGGNPSSGLSALGQAFFQKLFVSQQARTLVGHQATTIAGVDWRHWQCENDCSDFASSANGKHAAVAGWELESHPGNANDTLDWVSYALTFEEAQNARNRGAINTFNLHPRRIDNTVICSAWVGVAATCAGYTDPPANYCNKLLPGGQYRAQWLAKLDGYAAHLNTLQSGGQPVPFLLRPFHEADGNWFWWGTTACNDADFKSLFRDMVQYLRNTKGLKHMLVVYAPGIFTTQAQYLARYPGDDVVDVIAFDQYLAGGVAGHGTTVADLTNKLSIVHALAQARGKIAAWAEAGQQGLSSNNAFTQIGQAITNSSAKLAYVMFWANYERPAAYVPYPASGAGAGSPAAQVTDFRNFLAPPRAVQDGYPSLYP